MGSAQGFNVPLLKQLKYLANKLPHELCGHAFADQDLHNVVSLITCSHDKLSSFNQSWEALTYLSSAPGRQVPPDDQR